MRAFIPTVLGLCHCENFYNFTSRPDMAHPAASGRNILLWLCNTGQPFFQSQSARRVVLKTAIVTGAGSGIGLELTKRLLREGWSVAALLRRPSQEYPNFPNETIKWLRVYTGDLSDAAERRAVVTRIAEIEPRIDILFNNAGVSTATLQFSPQGREMHYEVNTIAPYVLTEALTANLAAAGGRVVNTVSDAIFFDKRFDPNTLAHPARFKKVTGPYASSKLALALWSKAISPALATCGVSIVSVTPGPNDTPLLHGPGMPTLMRLIARMVAKPPTHGAGLLLDAAVGSYRSGDFLMKGKVRDLPCEGKAERTLDVTALAARE